MHDELWITALFNKYLAGVANTLLSLVHVARRRPGQTLGQLRDHAVPGGLHLHWRVRHICARGSPRTVPAACSTSSRSSTASCGSRRTTSSATTGKKYLHFFGTIFLFILFCEPDRADPHLRIADHVPAGAAGLRAGGVRLLQHRGSARAQGVLGYAKHFAGPMLVLAPLMIPIEIISHLGRLLSLTIRLYANMFAGEQVTLVFMGLVPLGVPVVFMGLHVFVSFLAGFHFHRCSP